MLKTSLSNYFTTCHHHLCSWGDLGLSHPPDGNATYWWLRTAPPSSMVGAARGSLESATAGVPPPGKSANAADQPSAYCFLGCSDSTSNGAQCSWCTSRLKACRVCSCELVGSTTKPRNYFSSSQNDYRIERKRSRHSLMSEVVTRLQAPSLLPFHLLLDTNKNISQHLCQNHTHVPVTWVPSLLNPRTDGWRMAKAAPPQEGSIYDGLIFSTPWKTRIPNYKNDYLTIH